MKNLLFGLGRVLIAALVCFTLIGHGAEAKDNQSPMEAFREAMTLTSVPDSRIFRQEFSFFGPTAEMDLEFLTQTADKSSIRVQGNLTFFYVDEMGKSNDNEIPFYMTQSGSDMVAYFKGDKGWVKFDAPDLAAIIVDALATPEKSDLDDMMNVTKNVEVLQDTDARRTMLVRLDGKKLFKLMQKFDKKDQEKNLTEQGKQKKDAALPYLEQALNKSDIWYTWTVDKKNWQTITVSMHLSDLLQQLAQAALADPTESYSQPVRELLETVAYYGEAKAYTTYLNPALKSTIDIPADVLEAKPVDNILQSVASN